MNNLFFQRAYHIIFIRDSASKTFFGKPFVNERSCDPRSRNVVTLCYMKCNFFLVRDFPGTSFFFLTSILKGRKGGGGLFYIRYTLSYAFLRFAREQIQNSDCSKRENGGRWLCRKKIRTRMIVYLFLITPDRIYIYIRKIPVCVLLAFILFFLSSIFLTWYHYCNANLIAHTRVMYNLAFYKDL